LARVLLAGLAISALHASLSLAVSSLTSRRAVASAAIVIVLVSHHHRWASFTNIVIKQVCRIQRRSFIIRCCLNLKKLRQLSRNQVPCRCVPRLLEE
jgi:hypothetical protein